MAPPRGRRLEHTSRQPGRSVAPLAETTYFTNSGGEMGDYLRVLSDAELLVLQKEAEDRREMFTTEVKRQIHDEVMRRKSKKRRPTQRQS